MVRSDGRLRRARLSPHADLSGRHRGVVYLLRRDLAESKDLLGRRTLFYEGYGRRVARSARPHVRLGLSRGSYGKTRDLLRDAVRGGGVVAARLSNRRRSDRSLASERISGPIR